MVRSASRAMAHQRGLVRVDRVEPDAARPLDRGMQPDRVDDVRRARLEPRGRRAGRSSFRTSPGRSSPRRPARAASSRECRRAPTARRCRSGRRACAPKRRRNRSRAPRRRPAAAAPPGSRRAAASRRLHGQSGVARFASRIEPSTFETCANATIACSSVSIAAAASRSICPSCVSGHDVDREPASCQGTILL